VEQSISRLLHGRKGLILVLGAVALLFLSIWLGARSGTPQAPALHNGPVYKSKEGFRFLISDTDWAQCASAVVPPGRADDERMVVEYKLQNGDSPAGLRVTAIDLGARSWSAIEQYLVTHSPNRDLWRLSGVAEPFTVNGAGAARITLLGTQARKGDLTREIVAFRRGERKIGRAHV
jgi:hypothetical protein